MRPINGRQIGNVGLPTSLNALGVVGDVTVDDSPRGDVEHDEDVHLLEGRGHHHEEVAGKDRAGLVAEECCPRLRRQAAERTGMPWHVSAHNPRRDREPELQPEFRGDALLTPRAIGCRHLGDELL